MLIKRFDYSDTERLYARANEIIGGLTPLKEKDCGVLCECACCKGDDDVGMLLFPGEKTTLKTMETPNGTLAICDGSCEREKRPLACRIFPFFPAVDENGRVQTVVDARAMRVCPLAAYSDDVIFDRRFISAVKKVGRLLAKNPECFEFMREITENIELLEEFYSDAQEE